MNRTVEVVTDIDLDPVSAYFRVRRHLLHCPHDTLLQMLHDVPDLVMGLLNHWLIQRMRAGLAPPPILEAWMAQHTCAARAQKTTRGGQPRVRLDQVSSQLFMHIGRFLSQTEISTCAQTCSSICLSTRNGRSRGEIILHRGVQQHALTHTQAQGSVCYLPVRHATSLIVRDDMAPVPGVVEDMMKLENISDCSQEWITHLHPQQHLKVGATT